MLIANVIAALEQMAPPSLQESYDNCGLITGTAQWQCTGIICSLDCTEPVVEEAIANKCNLIVAHHPIVFGGLKKINGKNYVERTIIAAIKNDIAIYAIHTNLDNVLHGVNKMFADKLHLHNQKILAPKAKLLKKLYTYITKDHIDTLRNGLFESGAGNIGNYSECSFSVLGTGTFKGNEKSNPQVGEKGKRSVEEEFKIEILFPVYMESAVLKALRASHYYEEIAYEIITLDNTHQEIGSGIIGSLATPMSENEFLAMIKAQFGLKVIRHTNLLNKPINTVAVCGGSGSSLINNALAAKADAYITADVKYHEFFDADNRLLLLDIGHYESEQFTIDLIFEKLSQKFTTFAVLKTKVNTNSVHYYV